MALLSVKKLSLAFGWKPLLDEVSFAVDKGERIALLGRNGEGKSTLLNILRGAQTPDEGEIQFQSGVRVAYLPQDPPAADERLVQEVLADGYKDIFDLLAEYQEKMENFCEAYHDRISELENQISAADGWNLEKQIETVLLQFELNANDKMSDLSGGWRRRVWLARVILQKPDILLLDEPTNHLDINAIAWLEQFLLKYAGSTIFVTHDRAFMQNIATRIWELDRGQLLDVVSDYQRFLRTKEEMEHADALAQAKFDKKLAEEEVWIRKGIQARRTRNEGRVRALQEMRKEYASRIQKQGMANLQLDVGARSGKQIIEAKGVSFQYPGQTSLIKSFTDIVERGEKIGIIGANGIGKTTLIKVMLGELQAQEGSVKLGTNLTIAYFDQLRTHLDLDATVRETVGEGSDHIEVNGQRKHIASYLQDFLFPPERWNTPVSALSGGEKARLLLAKLFAQPANVLVLDEPTNDLDIETLELLEEILTQYKGSALIVSHDRAFLDNVVTRSWIFNQKKQKIQKMVGGFTDWLNLGGDVSQLEVDAVEVMPKANVSPAPVPEKKAAKSKKLSYKFQRELEALPAKIQALEFDIESINQELLAEKFQQLGQDEQVALFSQLEEKQLLLDQYLERWMQLESGEVE